MQEDHQNRANIFTGVMDLDSDLTVISQEDYRYALSVRNGQGATVGAVTNVKGCVEVTYELPVGENICIGTVEERKCVSVVYFVWNSLGNHLILRFFPQKNSINSNGSIELITCGPILNFKKDWLITHACVVDGNMLYWTDAYTEKNFIEGNPPRKINIEKANVTGKKLEYEVHVDNEDTFFMDLPLSNLDFSFTDIEGQTASETFTPAQLSPFQGDPFGFLSYVHDRLLNSVLYNGYIELLELCDCKLRIITKPTLDNPSVITVENFGVDDTSSDFIVVPINHYGVTTDITVQNPPLDCNLQEQNISLIKKPPTCEPVISHFLDPNVNSNNLSNELFQFRVRYWFDDFEKSVWSAISNMSVPIDLLGNFLDVLNVIKINFTEPLLNDPLWRSMIRKVEIAFRAGNNGLFKQIDCLDICEIGLKENSILFYNDKIYSTIAGDDEGTGDTQVLKHYDFIPRLTGGLDSIASREGNNRLFLSACLENYNIPNCVELALEANETFIDECTVTIRGTVNVNQFPGAASFLVYEGPSSNGSTPTHNFNDGKTFIIGTGEGPGTTFRGSDIMFEADIVGGTNNLHVFETSGDNYAWVHDLALEGFVVYLAGTDYFGISKNFITVPIVDRDGSFEIKNVPKGQYVMRVASFLCTYSDLYGEIHNLNNGRAWQKTSAPVLDCAGSFSATGIRTERLIDLTGFSGQVFDLDTEVGYGPILVENMHETFLLEKAPMSAYFDIKYTVMGYFLDNEALAGTREERLGAIGVERQKVNVQVLEDTDQFLAIGSNNGFTSAIDLITDHNGFFFYTYRNRYNAISGPSPFLNRKIWKNLYPVVPDVCSSPNFREMSTSLGSNFIFSGEMYQGGLSLLYKNLEQKVEKTPANNNPFTYNPNGLIYAEPGDDTHGASFVLLFNTDTNFTEKNKTLVRGRCVDINGFGLSDVLITIERNGRQEPTDSNGDFAIAVYCPYDGFVRDDDRVFPTYLLDKCAQNLPTLTSQLLDINAFCSPYDSDNPYTIADFVFPNSGPLASNERYLKSGGVYKFGVVYEDEYGRKSSVVAAKEDLRIPFHTVYGSYEPINIVWTISSIPPIWAKRFRLVRTRESYYRRYLHEITEEVRYVRITDINAAPIGTSFANGDATHIMIRVSDALSITGNNNLGWFFKQEENNNFEAQQGDRIRIILDEQGNIVDSGKITDVRIEAIGEDGGKLFFVIKNEETFREILPGFLIELYSPKKNEELTYFEIGECHDIIEPYTVNRRHSGPITDQDYSISQNATGSLKGGDTYWRIRDFGIEEAVSFSNRKLENSSVNDRFSSSYEDIGRGNIVDPDYGERFFYNRVRYSRLFVPTSRFNGLSSFGGLDYQDIDTSFGIIKKIISIDTLLMLICEFKIQPIYVGKDNLMNLDGATNVGRSDRVLNLAEELKQNLGTMNPESIVRHERWLYGFDVYKGVVWRYATNGLHPISEYKAKQHFSDLGELLLKEERRNVRIVGGYERKFNCYLLTFFVENPITGFQNQTISFAEGKKGFNTYHPFIPEYYGVVGDSMVSFNNGELWVHESNDVPYNNFYGIQYTSKIQPVFNHYPKAVKILYNIELQGDKLWFAEDIEIPANHQYPDGMKSRIKAGNWINTEGTWKADFFRDMLDPSPEFSSISPLTLKEATALLRGRPLRCEVMLVTLTLEDPTTRAILRRMDVEYNLSNDTKI